MSLGQELAPHLPFLRRYGRALTGSQAHGDAFVRATLEAIVASPEDFPRDVDPRLGLYRTFHAIWSTANIEAGDEPSGNLGFGGAEGFARVLVEEGFDLVIDATHPFAVHMKANAIEAARVAGIPLLAIRRPPWVQRKGDRWIMVESLEAAAAAIGEEPRRVFLTTGRMELAPFRSAPQHLYIVRSVEAPSPKD